MSVTIIPDVTPRQRGAAVRKALGLTEAATGLRAEGVRTTRRTGAAARAATLDRADVRRAIATLPALATAETAVPALRTVARDVKAALDVRRLATDALGRVDDAAAVRALRALVADEVDAVAAAAITAVGRGPASPASLEAVASRAAGRGVPAARARFAAALLAHRLGRPGHDLRRVKAEPVAATGRAVRAQVRVPDAEAHAAARASVAEAVPALPLDGPALEINCLGRRTMLLGSSEAAPAFADPALFAERRWHLGQAAVENPTNGRFSPGLSILTTPGRSTVHLAAHRIDGSVVFQGEGRIEGGRLVVAGAAVRRPGAVGVSVTLTVAPGELSAVVRSDRTRAVEPRQPKPA